MSVQHVGFLAHDLLVEWLEAEPTGHLRAHLRPREARLLRVDLHRLPGRLGEELRLAAALEREEPVDGLVHRAADGEQAVVAQDDGLLLPERLRDAAPLDRKSTR